MAQAAKRTYEAFAPAYDDFTGQLDYEPWLAETLPLLARHGVGGGSLLDVGCGTGKSLIPMLERGWQVCGCDISPAMLEIAREKIGDGARLEVADMRELPALGSFDLVWSLNDSVNYLEDRDDLEAALGAMRRNLAPQGLLAFDVNTLVAYRRFFGEERIVERGGRRLIWRGRATPDQPAGSICEADVEAEGGEDVEAHTHRQRHFAETTVREALRRSGLALLEVFGQDLSGRLEQPLDEDEHVKALYLARRASGAATFDRSGV